jgi:long-subunit fatty acid transport protein
VFKGNGARGVKTWLSPDHVLEINPHWLGFPMFESMDLTMTDRPPGPGQSEPQEWRSAFTVGMSTDWHVSRTWALHAGYRFYDNPIPREIQSGAYPNASQHVLAVGLSLREGSHSLSMIYGADLMDPASGSGISSARHGNNLDPLAHLVSLTYSLSF